VTIDQQNPHTAEASEQVAKLAEIRASRVYKGLSVTGIDGVMVETPIKAST
jgi:hypothetical protein